jgi:hypothetical protein
VRDIDTAVVDSLKVLDPKRPIREADIVVASSERDSHLAYSGDGALSLRGECGGRFLINRPLCGESGSVLLLVLCLGEGSNLVNV